MSTDLAEVITDLALWPMLDEKPVSDEAKLVRSLIASTATQLLANQGIDPAVMDHIAYQLTPLLTLLRDINGTNPQPDLFDGKESCDD